MTSIFNKKTRFTNLYYLLSFIFFFAQPLTLQAKNYYVNSKTGNKVYKGTSPSKAKNLIQDAIDLAKPGDVVYVMDGTYTNACPTCNVVTITKSGSPNAYITLTNYPDQRPKVKFNGWAGIAIENGASYIKMSGFELIGNNANVNLKDALKQPKSCANKSGDYDPLFNGNGIAILGDAKKHSHHIQIANNVVHDCGGGGIGANQADYIEITGNVVYNNSWYSIFGASGISLYEFWNYDGAGGYHNHVTRNKCYNNKSLVPCIKTCVISDGNGIIIDDFRNWQSPLNPRPKPYTGRTLIENNVCWYNGGTGIHTFQSDHVDIVSNTAYCNSQSKDEHVGQILPGGSSDIQIVNNIMVADSSNAINSNFLNKKLVYSHNLHYNVTFPDNTDCMLYNATCIMGKNPMFLNPANALNADFRLKKSSPAIGRGNTVLFGTRDISGKTKSPHKAPDIGAYIY